MIFEFSRLFYCGCQRPMEVGCAVDNSNKPHCEWGNTCVCSLRKTNFRSV